MFLCRMELLNKRSLSKKKISRPLKYIDNARCLLHMAIQ